MHRGKQRVKTETRRTPCDHRGRDGGAAATSQGAPGIDSHHQKLGRDKKGFSPEPLRERGPDDTLISDC